MRAGLLRHRATLLLPTETDVPDEAGDTPAGYKRGEDLYCAIEPLSARELFWAAQVRPDATHKITMRYRTDINATCALEWFDGTSRRVFHLGPVMSEDNRNVQLQMMAVEAR